MIAAIYARKSTDQNIADEEKSVTRQVEHAKAYAARKGWTVAEEHVYADDGISGAEFKKRPGLLALLNALSPRPPFQALVMSEESRLGREQIETSYVLKQIIDAGARVFFYLEDRERTLETAMDKVMLSLTNFAAEMEREKARQRTRDAMVRKARAGQVAGGQVYGYDNREITAPGTDGQARRLHVIRVVNPDQAAVVRRIFELYAQGIGIVKIAKRFNEERVPSPRANGWAPTAIREMLYRPLYRGLIVWNQRERIDRGGTKKRRRRAEADWIQLDAPELRIIPEELWLQVRGRLDVNRAAYARGAGGRLLTGRPSHGDIESKYLLTGFVVCVTCGGSIIGTTRPIGGEKRHYYRCAYNWKRGAAVCDNATSRPTDILDSALLHAIAAVLDERLVGAAIERALEKLRNGQEHHLDRRTQLERELSLLAGQERRLIDAIADGIGDRTALGARLTANQARKATLTAELAALDDTARLLALDGARLRRDLRERIASVKDLLGRQTPQGRQALRRLLDGEKLQLEPGGTVSGSASLLALLPTSSPLMVVPPG